MKLVKSTIGEIALEIKTGKTPPTTNAEYFGEEINWYTPTDLDREKILGKSARGITRKALDDKKVIVLKPNTILLGCIGDIGKIGLIKETASSNQQLTGILPKQDIVNSEFLYYWLKCNKNKLQDASKNAIVPILNNKQLTSIKIEYPEKLSDQIRIAEILSRTESLISQRKQSINLLDELLKSTFIKMFEVNNKPWITKELKEVVAQDRIVTYGIVQAGPHIEGGVPYIKTGDIKNGKINVNNLSKTSIEIAKSFKRSEVNIGDIIMSIRATVGTVALLPDELDGANLTQGTARISPGPEVNKLYLFFYLQYEKTQQWINRQVKGATFREITLGKLRELPVVIPPIDLQKEFATLVEKVEVLKNHYQQNIAELQNMFGVLSQSFFNKN